MAPRPSPLSFRFEVDANAAFSVASLRCLRALSVSRAKRSRFEASYWDTADLSIRRHEAAIEISRIDEGRWIERIYARGPAGEPELRSRVMRKEPRPSPKTLREFGDCENLKPLVVRRVARSSRVIRAPDSLIELTTERGTYNVASGRETQRPIFDLDLVLVGGSEQSFVELASNLVGEIPIRLNCSNPIDRAYDRLGASASVAGREWTFTSDDSSSLQRLVQRAALGCLAQIDRNLESAREGDDEALHQVRVGIRRYRTVFGVEVESRPDSQLRTTEKELKWVWDELGVVRDLDVLVSKTWPAIAALRASSRDVYEVARVISSLRDRNRAQLRRTLDGKRFQYLMVAMRAFAVIQRASGHDPSSTRGLARDLLEKHAARFARHSKHVADASAKDLHRLRIATKRLRYLAEFFAPLFDAADASRSYLSQLAAVQSALGEANDIAVGKRLLKGLATRLEPSTAKHATALYRRHAVNERDKLQDRIARSVRRARRAPPFWA